ncbi:MAG: SLC13 family permease [Desulfobacteraceae bacterium]|jgi:di/tricarboxylate transporter
MQIALVLFILGAAIVFLVTEWISMEVVALLVLGCLALTGLVSPNEALAGFSNPAVVTVWAVFILSGGLTRTGVGNIIGRYVLRMAGRRELLIVIVIMLSAGVMSAFMNNVAVAALMLPVVMDISRQTGLAPSRLLMPLAYGSLLGGLTTLIGTPPNILVSNALRDSGLPPFKLFDYSPIGVMIMVAGTAFVALIGRRLLPARDVARESSTAGHHDLRDQYELQERMFLLRVPSDSVLANKTLVESRLGSVLGLHVLGIMRDDRMELAPAPSAVIQAGNRLLVEGKMERMREVNSWRQLHVEGDAVDMEALMSSDIHMGETALAANSSFLGKTLNEIDFRNRFGLNVLTILRQGKPRRTNLQDMVLQAGDKLLVQGPAEKLDALKKISDFQDLASVSISQLVQVYRLQERLLIMKVPESSTLNEKTLKESRLGDALGMRVLCIIRDDLTLPVPGPEEHLKGGDRLIMLGKREDLSILRGLEGLQIEQEALPDMSLLESARIGLVEAVLSPRTTLAGKTLRQLHFREKYGLNVLAIWREGRAYRSDLRDMALRFGDALLLYGPRDRLRMLGREPDFLVLTQEAQEAPRLERAKVATLIMGCVLLPVILGLVPIYIAAVVGAALMVLSRCLNMEEAYRFIEWKAVFLIAGMLPLGTALHKTGAAKLLAEGVVSMVGPFGPLAVMGGVVGLTFLATCFIPTAALVVLMAPIVLSTSSNMGISPHALMMGIAMAASASFMTPISHPANILVMGPGGYRFVDYLKVGVPLTLVVFAVILLVLPYLWPLSP